MAGDTILLLVKVISAIVTGTLGIVGVLVDFREKPSGALNRWGKLSVAGIALSIALAGGAELLTTQKDRESALNQQQANNVILRNIERAVDPLSSLTLTAWLDLDLSSPAIASYRDRLLAGIEQAVASSMSPMKPASGVYAIRSGSNGIEEVAISSDSPLFPNKAEEVLAYYLIRYVDLRIQFSSQEAATPNHPKHALDIGFNTANQPSSVQITYVLQEKRFGLTVSNLSTDTKYWRNSSRILSVVDLVGKEMTLSITSIVVPTFNDPRNTALQQLRSKLALRTAVIDLPRGRQFWIRDLKMDLNSTDDLPTYHIAVPNLSQAEE